MMYVVLVDMQVQEPKNCFDTRRTSRRIGRPLMTSCFPTVNFVLLQRLVAHDVSTSKTGLDKNYTC